MTSGIKNQQKSSCTVLNCQKCQKSGIFDEKECRVEVYNPPSRTQCCPCQNSGGLEDLAKKVAEVLGGAGRVVDDVTLSKKF